jgi:glycerol-3-phosphate dehydrogenase
MEVARRVGVEHGKAALRLIKGSHIVVPRLYAGAQAYILQNDDRRIVFVLPFERDFTLIGTTEMLFEGDPAGVACTDEESAYLCRAVSRWFARPVSPSAIVWRYAGVRPLYEDHARSASAVTRDYVLLRDGNPPEAPMLSVLGGKITTHRRLAEHALERLALPGMGRPWTTSAPLPGGDLAGGTVETAAFALRSTCPWLDAPVADRLIRRYGSEAAAVLGDARRAEDLGEAFGAGLTAREIDWLRREEWAHCADDILWRRTKLGLRLAAAERSRLEEYLARDRG